MTGEELRAIREATGLSQRQFGPLIGKTDNGSLVSRYERGVIPIPRSVEIILEQKGKILKAKDAANADN